MYLIDICLVFVVSIIFFIKYWVQRREKEIVFFFKGLQVSEEDRNVQIMRYIRDLSQVYNGVKKEVVIKGGRFIREVFGNKKN